MPWTVRHGAAHTAAVNEPVTAAPPPAVIAFERVGVTKERCNLNHTHQRVVVSQHPDA